jgi:hypothetical protein
MPGNYTGGPARGGYSSFALIEKMLNCGCWGAKKGEGRMATKRKMAAAGFDDRLRETLATGSSEALDAMAREVEVARAAGATDADAAAFAARQAHRAWLAGAWQR